MHWEVFQYSDLWDSGDRLKLRCRPVAGKATALGCKAVEGADCGTASHLGSWKQNGSFFTSLRALPVGHLHPSLLSAHRICHKKGVSHLEGQTHIHIIINQMNFSIWLLRVPSDHAKKLGMSERHKSGLSSTYKHKPCQTLCETSFPKRENERSIYACMPDAGS